METSFKRFLNQIESTGSVSGLAPGQWADDNINGREFGNKAGIRSKYIATDHPNDTEKEKEQIKKRRTKSTPEEKFGIHSK